MTKRNKISILRFCISYWHHFFSRNKMVVTILLLVLALQICQGQLIKLKDDKSCSTKMASRHRVHSLMIGKSISQTLSNIADQFDCFKRCKQDPICQLSAHNQATKSCFFFKEQLAQETISRLIFEGWTCGRVNSDDQVSNLFLLFFMKHKKERERENVPRISL